MKYNPKINEDTCRLPGFMFTHPLQPIETVQGNLAFMYKLQEWLKEISGFTAVTMQPATRTHGEFTGVLIMNAYHKSHGDAKRKKMLIPNSAHDTNPTSTNILHLQIITIPSNKHNNINLKTLKTTYNNTILHIILTNPNKILINKPNILINIIQNPHTNHFKNLQIHITTFIKKNNNNLQTQQHQQKLYTQNQNQHLTSPQNS